MQTEWRCEVTRDISGEGSSEEWPFPVVRPPSNPLAVDPVSPAARSKGARQEGVLRESCLKESIYLHIPMLSHSSRDLCSRGDWKHRGARTTARWICRTRHCSLHALTPSLSRRQVELYTGDQVARASGIALVTASAQEVSEMYSSREDCIRDSLLDASMHANVSARSK